VCVVLIYHVCVCGAYISCMCVWRLYIMYVCVALIYHVCVYGAYISYMCVWCLYIMYVCVTLIYHVCVCGAYMFCLSLSIPDITVYLDDRIVRYYFILWKVWGFQRGSQKRKSNNTTPSIGTIAGKRTITTELYGLTLSLKLMQWYVTSVTLFPLCHSN
jgi:hypothetical protein